MTLIVPSLRRMVLIATGLALGLAAAQAQDASGFAPPRGASFFLLTDSAYSSQEVARVRMEVSSANLSELAQAEGADVALYRVDNPLEFLRQQRNLHRIDIAAAARSEGLANTLAFTWDRIWLRARQTWQNLFDSKLRRAATEQAPALKRSQDIAAPTRYTYAPAYKAMPGMKEVLRMRYPVNFANPIAPPKDLKLDGSSSNFSPPQQGNVYIPLGKQAPGLYVVEAAVGRQRALALLFITDTVAVTKTAADQFFVWAARRQGGAPAVAKLVWTDLNGILASGNTDSDGVWKVSRKVPQTSYVFGLDAQGGVFVSENFYYDSEIYNTKLYAYTDRPLYRPGDEVNIRLQGREFMSALRSKPVAASPVEVTVLDATGTAIHHQTVTLSPSDGASVQFRLPSLAPAGGYEIVMKRADDLYSAAFRVAPYVKPHFEIYIEPAQESFKTGAAIKGRIRLSYPDGAPVTEASLSLSARAQILTMVEGDLAYGGAFPVQIANSQQLTTDSKGIATFELPEAKEPSRLVLTVLATDGSAQRVRTSKELLIERSADAYSLLPAQQYAAPGQAVVFRYSLVATASQAASRPTRWLAIHQESQSRTEGKLAAGASSMSLSLEKPGSYTIELRDDEARLLAACPFFVSGGAKPPPQGAIEIVFDKARYRAGDTAKALITFPLAVEDALLTLERDRVEAHARLAKPSALGRLRRINERQWEMSLAVTHDHAPNISFSVAYVQGGEFGFQNAGLVVERPSLQIDIKTDKATYRPGETVTVDLEVKDASGRPASAVLSLAAVDEMVYALQPELAPSVNEFFYHLRRNNVRTHSSHSFISYDESLAPELSLGRTQRQERGVKMLERPRRDERDTAYFSPALRTDAQGKVRVSFAMPDALTRWRLTAKAFGQGGADGWVGERRSFIQSSQPVFAKWTAPDWMRSADQPQGTVAVFNQTSSKMSLEAVFSLNDKPVLRQKLEASPGVNFMLAELPSISGNTALRIDLVSSGKTVDSLVTELRLRPSEWSQIREALISVPAGQARTALNLPPDATDIRLRWTSAGRASWARIADSLIDYPYGCVEQTASRLVPLSFALQSMQGDVASHSPLRQRLFDARLRLASMAGPGAVFGWWGNSTSDNAFLSAYAYRADQLASQALGLSLPDDHGSRVLDIYAKHGQSEPLATRAWTLWLMRELNQPVGTLVSGLLDDFSARTATLPESKWHSPFDTGQAGFDLSLVLAHDLSRQERQTWPASLQPALDAALARLEAAPGLLPQALLVKIGRKTADSAALDSALAAASAADPTLDRALALMLLAKAADLRTGSVGGPAATGPWVTGASASGAPQWTHPAALADVAWVQPTPTASTLAVRYRSAQGPSEALPATLKRQLFRLEPVGASYVKKAVQPGDALDSKALYLDEVTVTARSRLQHLLAEVALPPGAMLERSTWGITLIDRETRKESALPAAIGEEGLGAYSIPFDMLDGSEPVVVQHLLRFTQRGQFQWPSARIWRMYQPQQQARESGSAVQRAAVR